LQQRLQRSFAVVSGEDSHDDFKPKYKSEPASDVNTTIENDIKNNDVFIYMKVCMCLVSTKLAPAALPWPHAHQGVEALRAYDVLATLAAVTCS
jgi:hypothetical protein